MSGPGSRYGHDVDRSWGFAMAVYGDSGVTRSDRSILGSFV